jgi:uncharacterized RDD family membrane protein YckC
MPYCPKCGSELPEGATYCPKCGAPTQVVTELKRAYWGERFVAWLIDVLIIGAILAPIRLLQWIAWPGIAWMPGMPTWIPLVDFGLSNVIHFLYWMLMEGSFGQSFGKMIMGLRVTKLDGKPINLAQAAIQSIGKAYLLPLDCLLGWLLYPGKKQRIFNYLSETIVVKG